MNLSAWLAALTPTVSNFHEKLVATPSLYNLEFADLGLQRQFSELIVKAFPNANIDPEAIIASIQAGDVFTPLQLLFHVYNPQDDRKIDRLLIKMYPWSKGLAIYQGEDGPELRFSNKKNTPAIFKQLAKHQVLFTLQEAESIKEIKDNRFAAFMCKLRSEDPDLLAHWEFLKQRMIAALSASISETRKSV